jgi:hypothetical protein
VNNQTNEQTIRDENDLSADIAEGVMISAEVFIDSDVSYTPWTDGHAVGFRAERKDGRVEYIYLNPGTWNGEDEIAENPSMWLCVGSTGVEETDSSVDFAMFCERYHQASDPLDKETIEASRKFSPNENNGKIIAHPWAIRSEGSDHYIHFPYDEEFLEILKTKIPANRRWWDKYKREWRIDADWLECVKVLLQRHFG